MSEDDQWEALKRWLKENGAWIVGGVVLGVGGLFGWRWWDAHVTERAEQASAQYSQMQTAVESSDMTTAQELAAGLHDDFNGTPYAEQAALLLVRRYVEQGEFDRAAEGLRALVDDSDDPYLREVARVRLARVELAQNKPDAALATLEVKAPGAFSAVFSEVRGDALLAKGDRAAARDAYRVALLEAGASGLDTAQLQLKLNDLAAPPVVAPAEAPAEQTTPPPTEEASK